MNQFFDRFALRAATIDERLSADFEALPGQRADVDAAARRLAAWCRSSVSGDWTLFAKRLARDNLTIETVMPRLATVRRRVGAPPPQWASDAVWIDAALSNFPKAGTMERFHSAGEAVAFEQLILSVVEAAYERLRSGLPQDATRTLTDDALDGLCRTLARDLSDLCAPALFDCFLETSPRAVSEGDGTSHSSGGSEQAPNATPRYSHFVAAMRNTGFRALFEAKPVLLRLAAVLVREWMETTRELIVRLHHDLPSLQEFLFAPTRDDVNLVVTRIDGGLSDPHNSGRTVKLLHFGDGTRVLYKPKDLRLDAAWKSAVDRLNAAAPPVLLKAARVLAREGYGWVEFVEHCECSDRSEFESFFRSAGAWLSLFHVFAATDMHEQNMIATGDQPVPIDLEMLLQPLPPSEVRSIPEMEAAALAGQRIIESVTMTGLLPTYWRTPENTLVGTGGLSNVHAVYNELHWEFVNTDAMRPVQGIRPDDLPKNLPRFNGDQAQLGDYVDALISGFEAYSLFLCQDKSATFGADLFQGFDALPTRRVLRNTRFYYLLLERLKDHRNMTDGAEWSAHLDFVSRFSDWDRPEDPLWPVVRSERSALAELCVPHFVSLTDVQGIADASGPVAATAGQPGLERAKSRLAAFDVSEIPWQIEVIRLSTCSLARSETNDRGTPTGSATREAGELREETGADPGVFLRAAADMKRYLAGVALRSGPGASWIGLDWLGHSGICRPTALGDDLYSGAPGVCVFLAAHAKVTVDEEARELSLAGLSALRHNMRSTNAPRYARGLGIGGATGMGSVVYSLVTMSQLLEDDTLLDDAKHAASLITGDLIAADWALDVFDGSAGCILGLLKLFQVTGDSSILDRAASCGDYLLSRPRSGEQGSRSWLGLRVAERAPSGLSRPLNGMSHGAAGFAYALAALARATGRDEFGYAAEESIAFENATFSAARSNWPDFRLKGSQTDPAWLCQWCHGAGGIGLARVGALRRGALRGDVLLTDVRRAVRCVEEAWPYPGDNMCCGNLGNIELLVEAGQVLELPNLREEASRRLAAILSAANLHGEYLFDGVDRRFDLGLFRGIAGIGYACLRQAYPQLPNILIWE